MTQAEYFTVRFRDFLINEGLFKPFIKSVEKQNRVEDLKYALKNSRTNIIDNCLNWSSAELPSGVWSEANSKFSKLEYEYRGKFKKVESPYTESPFFDIIGGI